MKWILTLALLSLAACADESISGYAGTDTVYRLQSIDGAPYPAEATLQFPARGEVAGSGPCNAFSASQTAPYPWLAIGSIRATRRACPDLPAEQAFFDALGAMTIAEVSGPTLLLTDETGRVMTFTAD